MRGYISVRTGSTGTTYELRVYAGRDERGKDRYVVETVRGSRRDAEKRLAQLAARLDSGTLTLEHRVRYFGNATSTTPTPPAGKGRDLQERSAPGTMSREGPKVGVHGS